MNFRTQLVASILVLAGGGLAVLPAQASILAWNASLGPEAPGATGTGTVQIEFDTATSMLDISAIWSGLSGVTTVAHIHCCTVTALTGTVGVAVTSGTLPGFPVGVTSGSYDVLLDLASSASFTAGFLAANGGTTALATAALITGLNEGRAYFNIHTNVFPGGEIRGFPLAIPEPGTLGLVALAAAGVAASRRRAQCKPVCDPG